jgi:serine/threonine-protein kinase
MSQRLTLLALLVSGYFLTRPPEIVEPSLFENPPPAAEMTAELQAQVTEILEVAEVHQMVGRLLSPPGSNALDEYRRVLEINPYNRQAIAGLRSLLQDLSQQARAALDAGDLERAGELVKEGLKIHDKDEALLALSQALEAKLK